MTSSKDDATRVFDRAFKDRGGIARIPSGSSRLVSLLTWYQNRCRSALPDGSFHFDFVRNRRVNACATTDGGFNLIAFNVGAPVAFLKLYETLLSNPHILPDVGDPSKDPAWQADLSTTDLQDGDANIFPAGVDRITSDPTRAAFIHHCTQFAMDFIYWHEVFHVLCGHVGYCARRSGQAVGLPELEGRPDMSAATSQALELEADLNAAAVTGGAWLREALSPGVPFRDGQEALRTWAFSLAIVFLVFDQSGAQVRDYRQATHPHPAIRAGIALNSLASLARKIAPHLEGVVDGAWEQSSRDCRDLARILKLRPTWIDSWKSEPDVVTLSMEFLVDHLQSIHSDLGEHANPSLLMALGAQYR